MPKTLKMWLRVILVAHYDAVADFTASGVAGVASGGVAGGVVGLW